MSLPYITLSCKAPSNGILMGALVASLCTNVFMYIYLVRGQKRHAEELERQGRELHQIRGDL